MSKKMMMSPLLSILLLISLTGFAAAEAPEPTDLATLRAEMAQARSDLAEAAQRLTSLSRQLSEQGLARRWAEIDAEQWHGMISELPDAAALQRAVGMAWAPRLGIVLDGPDEAPEVNRVRAVTPGSSAEAAGIEVGDRLLRLDGIDISQRTGGTVRQLLREREVGETVVLELERDGQQRSVELLLERPQMPTVAALRGDGEGFNFEGLSGLMEGARQPGRAMALGRRSNLSQMHAGLEPYFGIDRGVLILRIDPDNDLDLVAGDVILSINGEEVSRPADLMRHLMSHGSGESIELEIIRRGDRKRQTATWNRPKPMSERRRRAETG